MKLDKFVRQNPQHDYIKNLRKESDAFAQTVQVQLENFRNGNSWKSTNNSDSLGGQTQPQDRNATKMQMLQNKLKNVNSGSTYGQQQQQDLNTSNNKMSAFEEKMAKFQQRKSAIGTIGGGPSTPGMTGNAPGRATQIGGGNQQNLHTSFSALNNSFSQKWAAINSNKKIGSITGRPQLESQNKLAQSMLPGSNFGGGNKLNMSQNKFQSKMQGGGAAAGGGIGGGIGGGFASRLQNKANNSSLGGKQEEEETGTIGQKSPFKKAAGIPQPSSATALNRSTNAGGISGNSFRNRLQGLGHGNQTNVPVNTTPGGAGNSAASNQDLQKRLADMKAKLQGLKK